MTSFFMAIPAKLDFEIWPMANTMNQREKVVANSIAASAMLHRPARRQKIEEEPEALEARQGMMPAKQV